MGHPWLRRLALLQWADQFAWLIHYPQMSWTQFFCIMLPRFQISTDLSIIATSRSYENWGRDSRRLFCKQAAAVSSEFLNVVRWFMVVFIAKSRRPRSCMGVERYISEIASVEELASNRWTSSCSTFSLERALRPSMNRRSASEYIKMWKQRVSYSGAWSTLVHRWLQQTKKVWLHQLVALFHFIR